MMKKIPSTVFAIGLCGLLILCLSQPADGLKEEQKEEVRRQISTVKTWQMIEELDLTEEQAEDLFPAQKSFEDQKSELTDKRLEVETELTELLEAKEKNRDLIKEKMVRLKEIDEQARTNEDRFQEKLTRILTVEQQAKYELFEKRFDERLRQMIRDIQKEELDRKERSDTRRIESGREAEETRRRERETSEKARRETPEKARAERDTEQVQRREEERTDNGRNSSRSYQSRDSSASRRSGRERETQNKTSRQQTEQKNTSQKRDTAQERSSRQQDEENRSSRSDNR
jgi:hypothetical protein